eukprot:TRINITY_DN2262_c0_g1_i1.p1 TRINITY_DN2262_c0_g1~~TRINITY_DN2262_c0_g1_i1.p1  ORF type:complete len:192 (-),score=39.89 TRINITY_DN2262_c0_g1_i1:197-694(-)
MVKPITCRAIAQMRAGKEALDEHMLVLESLGAEDAKAIAEELKVNTSLTILDVRGNPIRDAGAKEFAEALRVNTSLTTLHLENTTILRPAQLAAAVAAALVVSPMAKVPLTPGQRMAFLKGVTREAIRIPLDMARRILTQYKVAQGKREWDESRMAMGTRVEWLT